MTTLRPELLDELLADYETPEDLLGDEGLFKQLKKALLERALGAELSDHLGYEKGDPAGRGTWQQPQRPFGQDGSDRGRRGRACGTARPQRQLRAGDRAQGRAPAGRLRRPYPVALCARHDGARDPGLTCMSSTGVEVSPDLISRVTDAVLEEVPRLAEPAAGCGLSGGVLRRAQGQDPRRGAGPQQGGLSGAGDHLPGREGGARVCGSSRPRAPSSGSR